MKKTMLLLAGYPGTGKTYLCNKILERNNNFTVLSPDCIKEDVWDKYGFDTLEEKEILIQKSWDIYFESLQNAMAKNKNIISDYPFSNKQKDLLKTYSQKYNYQIITLRLIAQIDVLFERQRQRDMDNDRHMGHILNCYHKNKVLENRTLAEGLLTYEEFYNRCKYRGYDTFELGTTIEIDVTDFNSIHYDDILDTIFHLM